MKQVTCIGKAVFIYITHAAVCERGLSAPLALPPSVFHGFIFALSRAYPPRIGRNSCVHWLRPRILDILP